MNREKMLELLAILNPASAKVISLSGVSDEQLELALFHEAYHIKYKYWETHNATSDA
jgi:hypothetical protein